MEYNTINSNYFRLKCTEIPHFQLMKKDTDVLKNFEVWEFQTFSAKYLAFFRGCINNFWNSPKQNVQCQQTINSVKAASALMTPLHPGIKINFCDAQGRFIFSHGIQEGERGKTLIAASLRVTRTLQLWFEGNRSLYNNCHMLTYCQKTLNSVFSSISSLDQCV